ncbi:saccharopine dehydrogenase NADP-binding domain-containing protein [Kribbella sp. NPDC051952]|uniref:saccharopine dehydrogenase NADP-binding domain-containing protein n=1 Tax=Kribbella sp. NPDC051952 TaxID=3154851 RepID=UPI003431AE5F
MIAVYGATGHTGRLVSAELVDRGEKVILAGRDAAGLEKLAAELGPLTEVRAAGLDDGQALLAAMDGAAVVINCAGPFARSGGPVATAAIAAGAHYLDHAAEPLHSRNLFENFDADARTAKVVLSPGMSLYGAIADLLAATVTEGQGPVDAVSVAYAVNGWRMTSASKNTATHLVSADRLTYVDGTLQLVAREAETAIFDYPAPIGARPVLVNYPAGEVVTIPRRVDTRSVGVFMTAETFQEETVFTSEDIASADRAGSAFTVVVRATSGAGTRIGYVRGNDIYRVGALVSVEAAQALAVGNIRLDGARSAAELFAPADFLQRLQELDCFTDVHLREETV